jgi:hypothetical protein
MLEYLQVYNIDLNQFKEQIILFHTLKLKTVKNQVKYLNILRMFLYNPAYFLVLISQMLLLLKVKT